MNNSKNDSYIPKNQNNQVKILQNIKLEEIIATNQYKKIENNIIFYYIIFYYISQTDKTLKLNVEGVFQLYETYMTKILNDPTSFHNN